MKFALNWVKKNCTEGEDVNSKELQTTREKKNRDWETVVKMALITRDLMIGNKRLKDLGFGEEAEGHNAIVEGFRDRGNGLTIFQTAILWRRC